MIIDLAAQGEAHQKMRADIAIVGAGVAGLILAERIRRHGITVAVLESGGLEQIEETHPLNKVVQLGDAYLGATRGRFRCIGGTSTRWGGALLPFQSSDLLERPHVNLPAFPVGLEELTRHLSEAEALFSLDPGSYEEDFIRAIGAEKYIPLGDPDLRARFAKWPPFKKRNVANLFAKELKTASELTVAINATVIGLDADLESGRILSIRATHPGGKFLEVSADHFVICAGAIESTRLLLLFDRQYNQNIFPGCEALGHYFYDHISTRMADIRSVDSTKLNRMAGFRFAGSTMRSLRFELSPDAQRNERVGSANGHISFQENRERGAFEALRQLMRGRQRGTAVTPGLLLDVLRDLPYLAKLSFWRIVYRQLLWPQQATHELHVVIEQLPRFSNSIQLAKETDLFAQPLAAINWRVDDNDRRTFVVFRKYFEAFWRRHCLAGVGELVWSNPNGGGHRDDDVFHPGGSARMGLDPRSAVFNSDLRAFCVPNLWAASTATFPSGGGANPTLTLILLAMRLADHLAVVHARDKTTSDTESQTPKLGRKERRLRK
jgi:choline dehydrogenase-like flavoprotein